MTLLRRLLLLPLLAPLLAVLLVGAANPRPTVRLRLLIWASPPLPVGVWLLLAGAGGALLSGGATALALRGPEPSLQRQVFRPMGEPPEPRRAAASAPAAAAPPAAAPPVRSAAPDAGPSREPGDPAPTVAVAYRVIRRPAAPAQASAHGAAVAAPAPAVTSRPSEADQGWDAPPLGENW
ncbi:MAG: hypothetical protein AAFX65_07695 [Cyanobacteria bacterium J06638_7]